MIGFDATVLTLVLNPDSDSPPDPTTKKPVERASDRVNFLVQTLHKNREKIIIPTPVLAEVLVRSGPDGIKYVDVMQKASVFGIEDFDRRAAIELAAMEREAKAAGSKKSGSKEHWQKIKVDRQIVAICKVAGVHTLYTTDASLGNFARGAGIRVVEVYELPLPPQPPQLTLDKFFNTAEPAKEDADEPSPEEIKAAEAEESPEEPEPDRDVPSKGT